MRSIADACAVDNGAKPAAAETTVIDAGATGCNGHTGSDYSSAASTPTSSTITNGDLTISPDDGAANGAAWMTSAQADGASVAMNGGVLANGSAAVVANGVRRACQCGSNYR